MTSTSVERKPLPGPFRRGDRVKYISVRGRHQGAVGVIIGYRADHDHGRKSVPGYRIRFADGTIGVAIPEALERLPAPGSRG